MIEYGCPKCGSAVASPGSRQGILNVAVKIVMDRNIQLVSINTGIIDRRLGLATIELMTAASPGGILKAFVGDSSGGVQLAWIEDSAGVLSCYGT